MVEVVEVTEEEEAEQAGIAEEVVGAMAVMSRIIAAEREGCMFNKKKKM